MKRRLPAILLMTCLVVGLLVPIDTAEAIDIGCFTTVCHTLLYCSCEHTQGLGWVNCVCYGPICLVSGECAYALKITR